MMKGDTVMFTYLKLKNFKSFRDTEFDFRTTGGKPNNLIIIYGENGAGKSNLVEAFYFLKDTMYTVRNRNRFEKFKPLAALARPRRSTYSPSGPSSR